MSAIRLRLRCELRAHPWSAAAVVGAIGLLGALALVTVAGARRTDSALARQTRAARASNVALIPHSSGNPHGPRFTLAGIRGLPEVQDAYAMPYLYFSARTSSGRLLSFSDLHLHDSPDPAVGRTLDRVEIVAGRRADPSAAGELMVSAPDARRLGLHVGSRLHVRFGSPSQEPGLSRRVNDPAVDPATLAYTGPRVTLQVVGLYAGLGTLAVDFGGAVIYRPALLTAAFYRRYHARAAEQPLFFARLRHGGASTAGFARSLARLTPGGGSGYLPLGGVTAQLQRRVGADVVLLWALAPILAAIGLLAVAQALGRLSAGAADSGELATLHALGMTRRQLLGLELTRAGVLAVPGVLLAVALAIALSPLTPVGDVARLAEPHPGIRIDWTVLAPGAAVTLLLAVAAGLPGAIAAVRMAVTPPGGPTGRPPGQADTALARQLARLPLTGMLGARMVLAGGPSRARSVAAPIAVSAIPIAALAATLCCVASFGNLTRTPRLYGQSWELALGGGGAGDIASTVARLHHDPLVAQVTPASRALVTIDGRSVGLLGLGSGTPTSRSTHPTVIAGRYPTRADDILLGRMTLDELHRRVGETVTVSLGPRSRRLRIVGMGVVPAVNETLRLGVGGVLTLAGLRALEPAAAPGYAFVRLRDDTPSAMRRFDRTYGTVAALAGVPSDLTDVRDAESGGEPLAIALLAVVATASLLQLLASGLRRRRHELAVLKALGFTPTQLRALIAWQAVTATLVSLAVGLPLGALAGRWVWLIITEQLGVASVAIVPIAQLALFAACAVAIAMLVAVVPGHVAARIRPGAALRTE